MKFHLLYLLLSVLMIASCTDSRHEALQGSWQAESFLEEGDSVAVNLLEIRLEFSDFDRYVFYSTLNYREAGSYRLEGPMLFTQDTLSPNTPERTLRIRQLEADTLLLDMEADGKKQALRLLRQR